jgi:hypothetical protein
LQSTISNQKDVVQSSFHRKWWFSRLYNTEIATYSYHWLSRISFNNSTSKLFQSCTMFFAASTRASHFLLFKLSSFLFLLLQLLFWFLQFIEVVVWTSDDWNHLIDDWNFIDVFICLLVHICICHYLHCMHIYQYQSLSLFMILFHVSMHLYSLCS